MFSTVARTPLLAWATPSYQTADADKATVDGVSTTVETYTANNANYGLGYLDE
jgi:hypothetical protein